MYFLLDIKCLAVVFVKSVEYIENPGQCKTVEIENDRIEPDLPTKNNNHKTRKNSDKIRTGAPLLKKQQHVNQVKAINLNVSLE